MKKHLSQAVTRTAPTTLAEAVAVLGKDPLARKEQVLAVCRQWLAEQQAFAKERFLASNDVLALLTQATLIVDELLRSLYGIAAPLGAPLVSVVASGGYGRCELFPYSDIDILFLYRPEHEEHAAHIVESMLYVLWDLGFKVGQSHRTVEEALELAGNDITIRTSLLDARLVSGDKELFEGFYSRFRKEIIDDKVLEFVEAKLAERDSRHMRFGDSRYMLEPNVKEGKGGLRDVHTLWWLARAAYPISHLKELVTRGQVSAEEYRAFETARVFLCRVRAHLHYIVGRPEDRLTFDYQHALAVAMGFGGSDSHTINYAIERFMRRYFAHVRTVGNTTRIFCALLEDERKRKPRRSLARFWHKPWTLGNFKIDGERLNVRSENAFEKSPILMIELFRFAQVHGLDIHPQALKLIGPSLKLINEEVQNDPKANALFLEILLSEKAAESTLRRMSEAGVLGRFIPEFARIIGLSQFDMYHVYTVDEHTLVAVGMLHAMENGTMQEELPMASDLIHRVKLRRVLYAAMFLHDIAKGRGGNHTHLGSKITAKLAARFGFTEDEIETTAWLVANHLLFSNTAYKRDFNDPKTIQDFVALVQSPERLKLLMVLTTADIRAVSPNVWNAWKRMLLRELYTRSEQYMGTGKVELKQHQAIGFKRDLHKVLAGWSERDIEHYMEQGNPAFWASVEPQRHAAIARMVREAEHASQPLLIDTQHDYERSITEITVCTIDQHGLFSKIAGAMSLAGANIINAKIFTLKNGIAVEIFQLQDLSGEVFDSAGKLAKMSVYIEQVLTGELNLNEAFANRASPYLQARKNALPMPGQVLVDNDASNIHSVIELTGRDRSGLLHEVTRAIAEVGLSIVTAHISTYGTQVADVFYVKDNFGMKINHDMKMKQVQQKLLAVVNKSAA